MRSFSLLAMGVWAVVSHESVVLPVREVVILGTPMQAMTNSPEDAMSHR